MPGCKCRFCQTRLLTQNAYKVITRGNKFYFCNEEHYQCFLVQIEEINRQKNEEKASKKMLADKEREEKAAKEKAEKDAKKMLSAKIKEEKEVKEKERIAKNKADKDKAYYLICDIIGRKEIINTILWKEWALWNKVASNEKIGRYLEENKAYLSSVISRLEDVEFKRIRYLSTILKNKLGDFKPMSTEAEKPKVKVEETIYESVAPARNNKRRSLADLEDEF